MRQFELYQSGLLSSGSKTQSMIILNELSPESKQTKKIKKFNSRIFQYN